MFVLLISCMLGFDDIFNRCYIINRLVAVYVTIPG